eukprot:TRINITY_DN47821_c0_g1_i3.p1 TRINITY_DN47821_c0_g1~~TRINITY_DN47821_c0_g1_i3.p1  ORF type:complete len:198 (+),score=21.42 TRINITY_DN47821_c0_g1_i3:148-741(+)
MHQVGHMIWSSHWRAGSQIGEINRIEYWDFAFQQTSPVSAILRPGDRINTHCVYRNTPTNVVPFGQDSDEEMCNEFLYYYPALSNAPSCSYGYLSGVNRNATICGNNPLLKSNPETRDPSVSYVRRFPTSPTASYTCPDVTVSLTGSISTSTGSEVTTSSSSATTGLSSSTGVIQESAANSLCGSLAVLTITLLFAL